MSRTDAPTIACPFTVLVDSREQLPYEFRGLKADAREHHRPLIVNWEWAPLKSGDYSIQGMEDLVAIERKTWGDLYHSCTWERERFEEEHRRLAELMYAAVVFEVDLHRLVTQRPVWHRPDGPMEAKVAPKMIYATALAWSIRYGVHWWPVGSRRLAEITTFRLLEKFWKEQTNGA